MNRNAFGNKGQKKGEENAWLETYADMITLLMAFFVILLSLSSKNKKEADYVREGIAKGLNRSIAEQFTAAEVSETRSFDKPKLPTMDKTSFLNTLADVTMNYKDDGAEMVFEEDILFVPGSNYLRGDAGTVINAASRYLKQLRSGEHRIIVEGHTDTVSSKPEGYDSKWEYTAQRALALRDLLEEEGVEPEMLSIAAFAGSKPRKPNLDAEGTPIPQNNRLNRRLVIRIIEISDPS